MKPTLRELEITQFLAEIEKYNATLKKLEIERKMVGVTSARFDKVVGEINAIRIKLKSIQIRMDNLGALDKYAILFQDIPKF